MISSVSQKHAYLTKYVINTIITCYGTNIDLRTYQLGLGEFKTGWNQNQDKNNMGEKNPVYSTYYDRSLIYTLHGVHGCP